MSDIDVKKDFGAIAIVMAVAFFIGLGGGSFDAMMLTALTLYIGIRVVQLWPFIIIREKSRHEFKRQNRHTQRKAQEDTSRVRTEPIARVKEEETGTKG